MAPPRIRSQTVRLVAVALLAAVAASPAGAVVPATSAYFETPSKNIVCGYFSGAGFSTLLECGVASGLVPPAPKPHGGCKVVDPAVNRVRLNSTGPTYGFACSGDVGVLALQGRAPVLAYGRTRAPWPLPLQLGYGRADMQEQQRPRGSSCAARTGARSKRDSLRRAGRAPLSGVPSLETRSDSGGNDPPDQPALLQGDRSAPSRNVSGTVRVQILRIVANVDRIVNRDAVTGPSRLASPSAALVLGTFTLLALAAGGVLTIPAHNSRASFDGVLFAVTAVVGGVGFVIARRQSANAIGWLLLAASGAVRPERRRHVVRGTRFPRTRGKASARTHDARPRADLGARHGVARPRSRPLPRRPSHLDAPGEGCTYTSASTVLCALDVVAGDGSPRQPRQGGQRR